MNGLIGMETIEFFLTCFYLCFVTMTMPCEQQRRCKQLSHYFDTSTKGFLTSNSDRTKCKILYELVTFRCYSETTD